VASSATPRVASYTESSVASQPVRSLPSLANLRLAWAGAAALALAWLGHQVHSRSTDPFDSWLRTAIHSRATPALTALMWGATSLASGIAVAGITALSLILLWRFRQRRASASLAVIMMGALVLEVSVKHAFRRPRPLPYFGVPAPHSFSFPSGHALYAVALFGALMAFCSARIRSRALRVLGWIATAILIGLVGLSRIYLGFHYPTDVIAGYLLGFLWIVLAGHIVAVLDSHQPVPSGAGDS
jgi:membrane-associated phospholipid phosphatase